jgi:hypothetical protein
MPCLSTPSCFPFLHHQVTTFFMIDFDLSLGILLLILWPHLWLLGWARFGKVTHLIAFKAHEMR